MAGIIGMAIFLIFAFIWYFPLYKNKPVDKKPEPGLFWKSFFMGLGPSFMVGLFLPIILGLVLKKAGYDGDSLFFQTIISAIGYGVGEELSKFLIAFLILTKVGFRNRSHTALLFGAVGLGFGVFESFLVVRNILSAFVRGFFCLHVFFQLWMGLFYGSYLEKEAGNTTANNKKFLYLSFAVPIFVHIYHDVVGTHGLTLMTEGAEPQILLGIVLFISAIIIDFAFIFVTLNKIRKA